MARLFLTTIALGVLAGVSVAQEGVVAEVTADTIKIQLANLNVRSFTVSNELLTNPISRTVGSSRGPNPFKQVKKGSKVLLVSTLEDGHDICINIQLEDPEDAGVVKEVGKDSITVLNEKGKTTTYKVAKDLANNSRLPIQYSKNYPIRFVDVKTGSIIEFITHEEDGQTTISAIDFRQQKEKEK